MFSRPFRISNRLICQSIFAYALTDESITEATAEEGLEIGRLRDMTAVSRDPGHAAGDLEPEELASLIAMYTAAVGELVETRDPGVGGLARELVTLRADAIAALSRHGASGENGGFGEL